jgi:hypothetical protein
MEKTKTLTDFFLAQKINYYYEFLNPGTMANLRWKRQGPRFYKRGHLVLYRFSDIDDWLSSQPVFTRDSMPDRG